MIFMRNRGKSESGHFADCFEPAAYGLAAPLDVLLVEPPYKSLKGIGPECAYTLGPTALAGYLRVLGWNVAVLSGDLLADAPAASIFTFNVRKYAKGQKQYANILADAENAVWRRYENIIRACRPRCVGISWLTPACGAAAKIAELTKRVAPEILVIAGGHHPTFCPNEVLLNRAVDFVIRGEGEIPMGRLLEELRKLQPNWERVPSAHFRDKHGAIRATPNAPLLSDLDQLPPPARDLAIGANYEKYRTHYVASARGCPYACAFCSDKKLWGGKVRRRGVASVIKELKLLNQNYPLHFVDFVDGTFTYDPRWVRRFCIALLAENMGLRWRCTARYDNVDEGLLSLMKDAGCVGLYFGLESGSPRVLQAVGKKTTVEDIAAKSSLVAHSGLISVASIILGMPGETAADIRETLRFLKRLPFDVLDVNNYVPLPGTPYYEALSNAQRARIDWDRLAYKTLVGNPSADVSPAEMAQLTEAAHTLAAQRRRRMLWRLAGKATRKVVSNVFNACFHRAIASPVTVYSPLDNDQDVSNSALIPAAAAPKETLVSTVS
jgi:radical SAM superfamily enzyme YgiQ (UPF0313 family)